MAEKCNSLDESAKTVSKMKITQETFQQDFGGSLSNLVNKAALMPSDARETADEPKQINLTLPYPPSVNQIWRTDFGRQRVYTNKCATDYKKQVKVVCCQNKITPFGKKRRLVFSMNVYRPKMIGDLDNRIKLILDSLNKIAFYDDRQIVEIHAYRFEDKSNPRVEIEIKEV